MDELALTTLLDAHAEAPGQIDRWQSQSLAYSAHVKVVWDAAKNLANRRRHGVTFEEAAGLFLRGENDQLEILDEAHSDDESRLITIGPIERGIVLVVWTERDEATVRIISARWATRGSKLSTTPRWRNADD